MVRMPMSAHPIEDAERRLRAIEQRLDHLYAILDGERGPEVNMEMVDHRIDDCLIQMMALKTEFPQLSIDREAHRNASG